MSIMSTVPGWMMILGADLLVEGILSCLVMSLTTLIIGSMSKLYRSIACFVCRLWQSYLVIIFEPVNYENDLSDLM